MLDDDMKKMIRQQRMGFIATVSPEGLPNLSPKGTTSVWDDDHLIFADLGSPDTVRNLENNPACEINVLDYFSRKGYMIKGQAQVLTEGELFDSIHTKVTANRSSRAYPSSRYVIVEIQEVSMMISPGYSSGQSESEMRNQWHKHWNEVHSENS